MNIPWLILPALLLEACFYFLPAWPTFARRFSKLDHWLQAALIWLSGMLPVIALHAAQGIVPTDLGLLAVSLGIVCLWYLLLPHRPMADLLLLGLLAAFILLPWFGGLFPAPAGSPKLNALSKLLWLRIGIAIFLFPRKWKVPGFGLWPTRRDWIVGTQHFLFFLVILLPVGFYFQILRLQLPKVELWLLPLLTVGTFFGVLLFVAYGEEFFFRGVLQQTLIEGLGRWPGIIVASMAFGAVHLPFRSFPNWRFALLASAAGIFYGLAFERAKSMRAAMVAHALVVTVWTILFARSL